MFVGENYVYKYRNNFILGQTFFFYPRYTQQKDVFHEFELNREAHLFSVPWIHQTFQTYSQMNVQAPSLTQNHTPASYNYIYFWNAHHISHISYT